jgi:hypothetical protein
VQDASCCLQAGSFCVMRTSNRSRIDLMQRLFPIGVLL